MRLEDYLAEIEAVKERLARVEGVVFPAPVRLPSLSECVSAPVNDTVLKLDRMIEDVLASGIEAGTDETPKEVRPEGREPGPAPAGDAQTTPPRRP